MPDLPLLIDPVLNGKNPENIKLISGTVIGPKDVKDDFRTLFSATRQQIIARNDALEWEKALKIQRGYESFVPFKIKVKNGLVLLDYLFEQKLNAATETLKKTNVL